MQDTECLTVKDIVLWQFKNLWGNLKNKMLLRTLLLSISGFLQNFSLFFNWKSWFLCRNHSTNWKWEWRGQMERKHPRTTKWGEFYLKTGPSPVRKVGTVQTGEQSFKKSWNFRRFYLQIKENEPVQYLQKLQNASQAVESLPKPSRSFQKLLEHSIGFQMPFN